MSNNQELPKPLTAALKGTFAYTTIKNRLPVTITKAIDFICRFRGELVQRYSEEAADDCKTVIDRLSQLRYELTTNKPFASFKDNGDDVQIWNKQLDELCEEIGAANLTWFKSPWLFAECYMYRRIREAMLACTTQMKHYDPFEQAKIDTCKQSQKSTSKLIAAICPIGYEKAEIENTEILYQRFHTITQALLWSNKNDLSMTSGNDVSAKTDNLAQLLDSFEERILCNHTQNLWSYLNELKRRKQSGEKKIRVDIVLDNCAIELASDLLLCDFLLRNDFVDQISLHAKAYYWFISDVTKNDFDAIIRQFQSENSIIINKFQSRINNYRKEGKLILEHENYFWNLGYSFNEMQRVAPELYAAFKEESSLIIFKGDLNYRKLISDLNWPYETPLSVAVRDFKPTSICAIRTLKSDLIANLDTNCDTNENYKKLKEIFKDDNSWMINLDYGLIQFFQN